MHTDGEPEVPPPPLYWQRRNWDTMQQRSAQPACPTGDDTVTSTENESNAARLSGDALEPVVPANANDELIVVDEISPCIDLTDDVSPVIDLTAASADNSVLICEAQATGRAVQRRSSRKTSQRRGARLLAANTVHHLDSDEDVEVVSISQSVHGRSESLAGLGSSVSSATTATVATGGVSAGTTSQIPMGMPVVCPICLDDAQQIRSDGRQLSSTVCGHVFCDPCIKNIAKTQRMCPTCRRKLTIKSIHPLFI